MAELLRSIQEYLSNNGNPEDKIIASYIGQSLDVRGSDITLGDLGLDRSRFKVPKGQTTNDVIGIFGSAPEGTTTSVNEIIERTELAQASVARVVSDLKALGVVETVVEAQQPKNLKSGDKTLPAEHAITPKFWEMVAEDPAQTNAVMIWQIARVTGETGQEIISHSLASTLGQMMVDGSITDVSPGVRELVLRNEPPEPTPRFL